MDLCQRQLDETGIFGQVVVAASRRTAREVGLSVTSSAGQVSGGKHFISTRLVPPISSPV
jgi:hypothetical protein